MDVKKYILIMGLILFISPFAKADYKIFFIPFAVETFVPVDAENIEKQAHFIFKYNDAIFDQAFEKIKMSSGVDQSLLINLRAKIVRLKDKEVIYLNKPLSLLSSKMKILNEKAVAQSLIESIAGKAKEACKNPKARFIIKSRNCDVLGK